MRKNNPAFPQAQPIDPERDEDLTLLRRNLEQRTQLEAEFDDRMAKVLIDRRLSATMVGHSLKIGESTIRWYRDKFLKRRAEAA